MFSEVLTGGVAGSCALSLNFCIRMFPFSFSLSSEANQVCEENLHVHYAHTATGFYEYPLARWSSVISIWCSSVGSFKTSSVYSRKDVCIDVLGTESIFLDAKPMI